MNGEQAVARLAGRQFEQRLRMHRAPQRRPPSRIGRSPGGAARVRSIVAVLLTGSYPMLMFGELGSEKREPEFQRPRVREMSNSQHIAT